MSAAAPGRRVRRAVAAGALALAGLGCGDGGSTPAPAGPRSAVLVTIDTLRADALGAYGNPLGASPHLDRLAESGVVFEQAHAASPNTLPSHATLLTGKRPFRHGVRSNVSHALPESEQSVAERLAEAGFATAAEVAAVVLERRTGIDQGFQSFRDPASPDVSLRPAEPGLTPEQARARESRDAEDITRRGIEFLAERDDEPFFLWLHYFDPHWPRTPPEPFASRFGAATGAAAARRASAPAAYRRDPLYAAEVAYVDAQIGRLLEALDRLGLADRTLVVVTSDHGEGLGDHGEDSHAYFVYQSTMRVPLLLRAPDLPAGLRVAQPVDAADVAPTLLDWLDQPPLSDADGRSLLPLLDAPAAAAPRLVYGESAELRRVFGTPMPRFVREGRWKYLHKPRPALYDLERDPGERRDLAAEHPDRVARLHARLEALLSGAEARAAAAAELDRETAARLEALGYAVGETDFALGDELESLRGDGPDPEDMLTDVRAVSRVWADRADPAAALRSFTDLSRRYPDSSHVLGLLLDAQLAAGLAEEAVETLRRGVELAPDSERYWSNLGELLVGLGRREEARDVLREATRRFPCEPTSRVQLASQLAAEGRHAERIALLEAGIAADCDGGAPPELYNELAWALATAPTATARDGARAVALAERAVAGLPDHPLVLDTLAAAQAEAGDPAAARDTLRRARELARSQGLPEAVRALLRDHAAAVERGEPLRD